MEAGSARPLRQSGEPLPYGFNDAAPLIGQLDAADDIRLHSVAGSSVIRFVMDRGRDRSDAERVRLLHRR